MSQLRLLLGKCIRLRQINSFDLLSNLDKICYCCIEIIIDLVYICSLCVADFLFCVLVLPFNAMRFIQGTWTHGDLLCRLVPFVQYGNVGVSLLCIAMITINR